MQTKCLSLDFCCCFSFTLDLCKFIITLVPEADIDYFSLKLITAARQRLQLIFFYNARRTQLVHFKLLLCEQFASLQL